MGALLEPAGLLPSLWGTIDAMTMTNGESVIDTALAMAITVHVGAKDMDGAAIRITTSKVTTNNEPPAST